MAATRSPERSSWPSGQPVELVLEWSSPGAVADFKGAKVGCRPPLAPTRSTARSRPPPTADAVVLVVGTNDDWETEGRDRDVDGPARATRTSSSSGCSAANPRTVVVVNAGSPVTLPWADRAPALLESGSAGRRWPGALADVLAGAADPSGRLPTTFPSAEHNPSYGNFPGENGECRYGEGVLIGYRWYEARRLPVRFPFGHGLSYTLVRAGRPARGRPRAGRGGRST